MVEAFLYLHGCYVDYCVHKVVNGYAARKGNNPISGDFSCFLTQGFIASNPGGETVLLGRGGSDTSASYIAAKYNPALAGKSGQGISMEQTDNGNLLLGSTREFVGFNKENTLSGIRGILKQTATILPPLENFQVIRTFAGLRPFTPDGLPMLGPVKSLEGFIMAAGHEGDGIALSPITGDLMAQTLLDKKPNICIDPFSPDRFLPDRFEDTKDNIHDA